MEEPKSRSQYKSPEVFYDADDNQDGAPGSSRDTPSLQKETRKKRVSGQESIFQTADHEASPPRPGERPSKFGCNPETVKWLDATAARAVWEREQLRREFNQMTEVVDSRFQVMESKMETLTAAMETIAAEVRKIHDNTRPQEARPRETRHPRTREHTSPHFSTDNSSRHQFNPDRADEPLGFVSSTQRDQARDRGQDFRQQTEVRTTVYTTASRLGSHFRVRREDIGQFNPHYEDPEEVGIVCKGRGIIFTDVICFQDRLQSFLEDEETAAKAEKQILSMFQTLLSGPAVIWWNNELTETMRVQLRREGLEAVTAALRIRFAPDAATATNKFTEAKLTLKDIAEDDTALLQFIQRKLRYAHAMGILDNNNNNWYGTMVQIWSSLDYKIKRYLRAPRTLETLSDYMQEVMESRSIFLAAATERYPDIVGKRSIPPVRKDDRKYDRKHHSRHQAKNSRTRKQGGLWR
jgi:hypothetical protein